VRTHYVDGLLLVTPNGCLDEVLMRELGAFARAAGIRDLNTVLKSSVNE
jgi:hypothetical protein